ncbi:MAG: amidohydrolase family protein, partial [Treponemataceae bacterium]|nr:amidohydrolase family protein [Treponemataceae bacterium]
MAANLIVYNAHLVDSHTDSPGALAVSGGIIRAVFLGDCTDETAARRLAAATFDDGETDCLDAHGLTLMPAFVDMHVHFRYPGQTQKEDLDSGLNAAVAGGFGTVVLMPNTTPIVSTRRMAQDIMQEANAKGKARVFQTVSITKDFARKDTTELDSLDAADVPVITEDGHDVAS